MKSINKVAIFLHTGVEEIEAITVIDTLRRANIEIDVVSLTDNTVVEGSHQIKIVADKNYHSFSNSDYCGIIVPGGSGVNSLFENQFLISTIKNFHKENKMVAAICAAPQLLGKAGIATNKKITGYPDCSKFLSDALLTNEPTVIDQNIVTGQSAGTAIKFSLNIIEYLMGKEISNDVAKALVIK